MTKNSGTHRRAYLAVGAVVVTFIAIPSNAESWPNIYEQSAIAQFTTVRGRTCNTVSSCREAVELWCSGYGRADGDGDGIPCENVCFSLEQVKKIKAEIGC